MAPKLRVLISSSSSSRTNPSSSSTVISPSAGSANSAYPPTALCPVNSATPTRLDTPLFSGEISVFVRDFEGEGKAGDGDVYFGPGGREDMTYGIVVRGQYLDNPTADDIVFGNVFEHPIKDSLPWGTAVAVKFMNFIDPTLEVDLYCDKPWALSPAVATMNELGLARRSQQKVSGSGTKDSEVQGSESKQLEGSDESRNSNTDESPPVAPNTTVIEPAQGDAQQAAEARVEPPATCSGATDSADAHEDTADSPSRKLLKAWVEETALGEVSGQEPNATNITARRRYFANPANRQALSLDGLNIGMEFANGILDFNTLSAQLPRPFNISFPLLKYWDGQPVTYICRRRTAAGESPVSPDGVYWAVAFEIVDEEAKAALEKRGGKVKSQAGVTDNGDSKQDDTTQQLPASDEQAVADAIIQRMLDERE